VHIILEEESMHMQIVSGSNDKELSPKIKPPGVYTMVSTVCPINGTRPKFVDEQININAIFFQNSYVLKK
jgi:hypothetical protein